MIFLSLGCYICASADIYIQFFELWRVAVVQNECHPVVSILTDISEGNCGRLYSVRAGFFKP